MKKKLTIAGVTLLAVLTLAACSGGSTSTAAQNDQRVSNNALSQLQKAQPVPEFKYSQIRATLIAVEEAQASVTATTTFFFNYGIKDPITSCPSIGFPLASTTELTNPQQVVDPNSDTAGNAVISQPDPTGVYAGASQGTYVVCVAPNGSQYIQYWEGDVETVGGPAAWENGQIVLKGEPTVKVPQK